MRYLPGFLLSVCYEKKDWDNREQAEALAELIPSVPPKYHRA
jgi:hypothetical protein